MNISTCVAAARIFNDDRDKPSFERIHRCFEHATISRDATNNQRGAVCAQMVRCGKPNCKCTRGELHGPYFYHFARPRGPLVKRYVKTREVDDIRAACNARRQEGRRRRLANKVNTRELRNVIEQLRVTERNFQP